MNIQETEAENCHDRETGSSVDLQIPDDRDGEYGEGHVRDDVRN